MLELLALGYSIGFFDSNTQKSPVGIDGYIPKSKSKPKNKKPVIKADFDVEYSKKHCQIFTVDFMKSKINLYKKDRTTKGFITDIELPYQQERYKYCHSVGWSNEMAFRLHCIKILNEILKTE